jgi:putative ABC transport system permease protein
VSLPAICSIPVLNGAENSLGMAGLTIPVWLNVAVPVVLLLGVAVAAMVPALRGGRVRAVDAIAVGRTARVGRGRRAQRLAGRWPLPRPVSLGAARPFARPARSASMAAAVGDVAYRRRGAGAAVSLSRGEALRLGPVALASVFAGVPRVELSLQLGTVSPAVMRILSLIQQISTPAMAWCRIERCD